MKIIRTVGNLIISLVLPVTFVCQLDKPPRYVDNYFLYHTYAVQHHEMCAGSTLRDPHEKEAAVHALISYLRDGPNSPWSAFSFPDFPPMRLRDYWASVLAQLVDTPLHLNTGDSSEERDAKINVLLREAVDSLKSPE